jgi:formamidopyrimidine-DNA glycosylase
MPELPEVETIKRSLEGLVVDRRIVVVEVLETRLRAPVRENDFQRWVIDQRITGISRRAKYLVWELENSAVIVIHLGMSGRLFYVSEPLPLEKHTHVIFHLDDSRQIRFRDPRRFGLIEVVAPNRLESYQRFLHLGAEPLTDAFSSDHFSPLCQRSQRAIKNLLMDAGLVVGIGNIYANEILFEAGVHPLRRGSELTEGQARRIINATKKVLTRAVEKGGTTLNDFRDGRGEPGFFQIELSVYERDGLECKKCRAMIEKVVTSGRSTYYCPACQRF